MKITCVLSKKEFCRLLCKKCKRGKRVIRRMTYAFGGFSFTAKGDNMSGVVQVVDLPGTVDATVEFLDKKGNPAKVDGVPTWLVGNTAFIDSIKVSADGMGAQLHLLAVVDVSQVTINADVDIGAGMKNVDFVDTISSIPGEAVSANFKFGTVTPDS